MLYVRVGMYVRMYRVYLLIIPFCESVKFVFFRATENTRFLFPSATSCRP